MLDKIDLKWQAVTGNDVDPFLQSINPISGKHTANAQSAKVEWAQLPFYSNIALVRISDSSWSGDIGPFWFLAKQGQMFHLDGTSAPIHDANEAGPISVTEENVINYLRFFCFFVHGDEGPFYIVEDLADSALDQGKMDDATKGVVEGSIVPAALEGKDDNGQFVTSAIVLYGDALFSARFAMTTDGMIEMTDDDPIAGDLPVIPFRPKA